MDPTSDSGISQIFGRVLDTVNYGLSRAIDAEFPQPWAVNDPAMAQWTIGPQGQYYYRGQPAMQPGAVPGALTPGVLLIGAALLGLAFVALKG